VYRPQQLTRKETFTSFRHFNTAQFLKLLTDTNEPYKQAGLKRRKRLAYSLQQRFCT
jgi:hypothetical protein